MSDLLWTMRHTEGVGNEHVNHPLWPLLASASRPGSNCTTVIEDALMELNNNHKWPHNFIQHDSFHCWSQRNAACSASVGRRFCSWKKRKRSDSMLASEWSQPPVETILFQKNRDYDLKYETNHWYWTHLCEPLEIIEMCFGGWKEK